MSEPRRVHVAVGVVTDQQGRILITRRPAHVHLGGLWEFPGGKLEAAESVFQALQRELAEEVGINVQTADPLIKIKQDYPERQVLLDVWQVTSYQGTAYAREGQLMDWSPISNLVNYSFPLANLQIIKALQLPEYYAILEGSNRQEVLSRLNKMLAAGVKLLQIRLKALPTSELKSLAEQLLMQCREHQVQVLINSDLDLPHFAVDGVHLSSRALLTAKQRPDTWRIVGASCHNLTELLHAERLGLDFAVLAPIQPTSSHPGQLALGWEVGAHLLDQVNLPVYVMGGLQRSDLMAARIAGAQGVAGISAFL